MPTQIAEGIDERTYSDVGQRKPTYHDYLKGERGNSALVYTVPQEGINKEAAFAIAQRAAIYEFGQLIRGIGRRRHIGVVRENVVNGVAGFTATDYTKLAELLSPGEQITFKINAASDLEKAALSEIKTILEKGPDYIWLKV